MGDVDGVDVGTLGRACPNCHQHLMHGMAETRGDGEHTFVVYTWECIRCSTYLEIEKGQMRPPVAPAGRA